MNTKLKRVIILFTLLSFLSFQTGGLCSAGVWQNSKEWVSKKVTNPNSDLSFDEYYSESSGAIWWVAAALVTITAALAIFFTSGTASPIVLSIGTWIGNAAGLTGVAATNYGLALIGGGSIAAGGFGVAGGTVVLTAILAGTGSLIFDISIDTAMEKYEESKFIERAKKMPTLPLPRKDDGPDSFEEIVEYVDQYYDYDKPNFDPQNIDTVEIAIKKIDHILGYTKDEDFKNQQGLKTLKALYLLHTGKYSESSAIISGVISDFIERETKFNDDIPVSPDHRINNFPFKLAETKCTLPLTLWGISSTVNKDVELADTTYAIKTAIELEPKNKLNPLILAIYLDRLLLRQDKLKSEYFQSLYTEIFSAVEKPEISTPSFQVLLTRCYIMAKKHQDFLRIVTSTPLDKFRNKDAVFEASRFALAEYNSYMNIGELCLARINEDEDFMERVENKEAYAKLVFGLKNYKYSYSQLSAEFAYLKKG